MITVKAKKRYIEEIDRLLIMSNLEYTKNDRMYEIYNPERNYNSYQIKDIDKDGNPTELEEDNTYDDIDEIFL